MFASVNPVRTLWTLIVLAFIAVFVLWLSATSPAPAAEPRTPVRNAFHKLFYKDSEWDVITRVVDRHVKEKELLNRLTNGTPAPIQPPPLAAPTLRCSPTPPTPQPVVGEIGTWRWMPNGDFK